ncbi:hypothetical protein [Paenibacillus mucilaginosus]|uniref:Uncharacterized protein n=3 Tax=Paenibacillus mucilaginosus TaxID=61624 RepID=H6NH60_9BACL|nr:hypothetical protein [Paenibacillus mucilaginosus]AEI40086.1 hypothetical protein KNP414_01522 [Paenibacillus mucilaginosus KNP414]AFC28738.1 hypothetical protein PM3016_1830 [Paenibacillus mucilaginosus 3016]AFH60916.1 hypothetical protein B2K_09310 [Paenibacillus mucilaginosus K02]MCG7215692.1 hypothetical protein [Paenibacillus mucilaginosus]WDM29324.1 hypothetical protein KCX80_09270 [Paenibacillus mucilaginosus]
MSRLNEIMENHEQLEKLNALLKHYSVNAEFVTASLIEKLDCLSSSSEEEEGEEGAAAQEPNAELLEDLKRFSSGF